MVFNATLNSISVISRRQLTSFMSFLGVTIAKLEALKCLAHGHSHEKTQTIQCGSNPGPLKNDSNALPLNDSCYQPPPPDPHTHTHTHTHARTHARTRAREKKKGNRAVQLHFVPSLPRTISNANIYYYGLFFLYV